jgi:hypothetical protein
MRIASSKPHHARWRPRLGAILDAGAAIRTLVARLVTGGDHQPNPRAPVRAVISPSLRPPQRTQWVTRGRSRESHQFRQSRGVDPPAAMETR